MQSLAAEPIRVFLVDDHRSTIWGLERLIETAAPRMKVVGSASNRRELLECAPAADPDVILMDLDLGGVCSSEALPALQRETEAQVLILTGERDVGTHENAVLKGARGVVTKEEPVETILRAIEKVHAGEIWLNRQMIGKVMGALASGRTKAPVDPEAEKIASLTKREREIIAAIVRNKGAKSIVIAEELHMSEHTLRNHLTTVYSKLDVRGRLELFVYATEHGLSNAG